MEEVALTGAWGQALFAAPARLDSPVKTTCPGETGPWLGVFCSQTYGLKTGEEGSPAAAVPGSHRVAAGKPRQEEQPCCDSRGLCADLFAERLIRHL